MGSRFSIVGLVHRVTVKRAGTETDDGAGGVAVADDTTVYSNVRCRVSALPAEHDLMPQGYDGPALNQIVMKYSPNILDADIVTVPSGVVSCPAGDYRIVRLEQQQDDAGASHHTSIII